MKENKSVRITTVKDWFREGHTSDEQRELFLYMDFAMKYVHERGYCVATFNPKEIEILNNSTNQIKFNTLLKIPDDDINFQQKLINEDIQNSSTLQIILYSNFPLNTKTDFIKEHFDEFTTFLPEKDVPYYRGVIERGASVYFTEYELERVKRENENLEKEINSISNDGREQSNIYKKDLYSMFSNDKINNAIYKKINNNLQDSAFLNILIYPTVIIVLALVLTFVLFLIRNFSI